MQNKNYENTTTLVSSKRLNLGRILKYHALPIVVATLLLITIIQVLYPADRVLPLKSINGDLLSGLKKDELINYLYNRYYDAPLTIEVQNKKIRSTIGMAGIQPNYEKTAANVLKYPFKERIVPFSFLFNRSDSVVAVIDKERAKGITADVQKICDVNAQNAAVKVSKDVIELVQAKNGQQCTADTIERALMSAQIHPNHTTVLVEATTIAPTRTDEQVKPKIVEATAIINKGLKLVLPQEQREVSKQDLAAFLTFDEDPDSHQIVVSINVAEVEKYLLPLEKEVYEAPGATVKTLRDGVETAVTYGGYGKGINVPLTTVKIKDALLSGGTNAVEVVLADLSPRTVFERSYSNTQTGLDVLLQDITREKGNYSIAVMELYGQLRVGSSNTGKSYVTASTYKMFVAYSVLKSIEAGKLRWDDNVSSGRNTNQCLNDMIVLSDNLCAIEFGNKLGWATIERQMHDLGLNNTFFRLNGRPDNITTSSDEALFLKKLELSESLQGESRDKLIGLMKRQVYRSGIPKGIGLTVADKIGFLDGYLHDAGIVYGTKGTYVLVVLTNGGSWAGIADTAKRVNTLLAQ